jgi:N-acetylmuramoyl-L-alanine amidase|tara:strand:- start:27 stop:770 length:744 start_codon:yes stop_codon:yes gene_type:complete
MAINISLNYSPNFYPYKRKKNQIKFIIFHYTGMKKESAAITRLTKIQSQVSSHYLIKNNGEIVNLVPDLYIAWHAGISSWKDFKLLNKHSIGIEISNPGHEFNYKKFSKKQIGSLLRLTKFLIKKFKINPKNILGHSDISPDRKKDPGEKFPWEYLAKKNIGLWHKIEKKILKNFRENKIDHLSQKAFLNNIYKIGYSRKSIKKIDQKKYQVFLIKSFQRRFRQELVNGKIDRECLLISSNLIKRIY